MSRKKKSDQDIKRMADLLREGATLTEFACPVCSSPLFRLGNGDLWCGHCQKKVIVVKEGEEPPTASPSSAPMQKLEQTLVSKIDQIQAKIEREENLDELQKLNSALSGLLDNLEKLRKSKRK